MVRRATRIGGGTQTTGKRAAPATAGPKGRRRIASVDGPDPIDTHVGQRVRERRTLVGISQTVLGEKVGLTFQQIQKYENGKNRVSASRLWQFSQVLGVPVAWFFEGIEESAEGDPLAKRETLRLVRYFVACPPELRKQVFALIKSLSSGGE